MDAYLEKNYPCVHRAYIQQAGREIPICTKNEACVEFQTTVCILSARTDSDGPGGCKYATLP